MKKLDLRMEPILTISSALVLYVAKGWKTRFDTQLDKLNFQKLSNYRFGQGYGEFRYDGFLYKIFDDKIIYRSLNSIDEYTIKKDKLVEVKYAS